MNVELKKDSLHSSFISGRAEKEQTKKEKLMKKMKQKLTILILVSLLALAGCNQSGTDKAKELELKEKELALKEKELESKQKAPTEGNSNKAETTEGNSDKTGKPESNSNKAEKSDGNSNKVETTKKVEKTNPAIVTSEQVNGTWIKGESVIKISALGSGKLKVSFNIFNERTLNQGSADGVANIDGIDATFSPQVDGAKDKCKFTMKFTGGKMIVEQFGDPFDCGFGNGVSADGTYTKK